MASGLVDVTPSITDEKYNFWDQNPQLTLIKPFADLYRLDKSKGKTKSSKEMIFIFFLCDPDPDINKFYRMRFDERLSMLKETFFKDFDETDGLIEECIVQYPFLCMTPVKRALKDEMDVLVERAVVLRNTEYTLDHYMQDETGRLMYNATGTPILLKGTATQLDSLRAKSTKLYEQYSDLEDKFLKDKTEARIKGGRKRNKTEKKLV